MLNSSAFSSKGMEWATPQCIFDPLHDEFHFSLDVCANSLNAKCPNFYHPGNDGLKQHWEGTCWMNPPYGREIKLWVQKAFESAVAGCVVVALIPVRSDTRWWHQFVMKSKEIRFFSRRLSFDGSTNKAPFPACIVVFGETDLKMPAVGVQPVGV